MSLPVQDKEFWKERIDNAQHEHHSVFFANHGLWNAINRSHLNTFKQVIPKGVPVLDAGCGYGRWSEYFDNYTGVDISPDFIDMAREKYPDKKFLVGDLTSLPFKKEEFDYAFCVSIKAMLVGNCGEEAWDKVLRELSRVAKKVLVLEYTDHQTYELYE